MTARRVKQRSSIARAVDCVTFPLRAFTLFHRDAFGLACQATERYDFAASVVRGRCLDVGCGSNRFMREFLHDDGIGVDVHRHEDNPDGLVVESLQTFPWPDESFASVTFLANINHVPEHDRDLELAEAYRVLEPGGNIVVTMAKPSVEIVVHKVVWLYDRLFGTKLDHDNERGMKEGEELYLTAEEITTRLTRAGFQDIAYRGFWTQWNFNGMFVGWKRP
ncbi:MAG: methyltransferase domain-containing protein [Gaiellales bacterium]